MHIEHKLCMLNLKNNSHYEERIVKKLKNEGGQYDDNILRVDCLLLHLPTHKPIFIEALKEQNALASDQTVITLTVYI